MNYTVGKFAHRFGLSRSTLLYYDRVGLLTPSGRSESGYRLYSEKDALRMSAIREYREAGIPLKEIGPLLSGDQGGLSARLERRMVEINADISRLRYQQQVIVSLLKNKSLYGRSRVLTKEQWVALLKAGGLDEAGMRRWHVEFESMSPEGHQDFLESLGIAADEIRAIRAWSRAAQDEPG